MVNSQADIIEDVLNGYLDTLGDKGQERLDELDGHLDDISQRVDQMTQVRSYGRGCFCKTYK